MGRILSAVAAVLGSLAGTAIRLVCFAFIIVLVLSNVPRFAAAGSPVVKLQVAAGVLLFGGIAYYVAMRAAGLGG